MWFKNGLMLIILTRRLLWVYVGTAFEASWRKRAKFCTDSNDEFGGNESAILSIAQHGRLHHRNVASYWVIRPNTTDGWGSSCRIFLSLKFYLHVCSLLYKRSAHFDSDSWRMIFFSPLYLFFPQRSDIVKATYEPTDEECEWKADDEQELTVSMQVNVAYRPWRIVIFTWIRALDLLS